MQDLKSWAVEARNVDKYMERSMIDHEYFFRDPARPMFVDDNVFFSPADGIILYQQFVKDMKKPLLNIKGKDFTLPQVMHDDEFNKPSLVISVFMTAYDVHINRLPTSGLIRYRETDPITTMNMPMLATEKGLLDGIIPESTITYEQQNERMVNRVYAHFLNYEYYLVQIADKDVDRIMPFSVKQNKWYLQGERFSLVRWGSEVTMVLPLTDSMDFELLLPDMVHVEAGQDALVRIIDKERNV